MNYILIISLILSQLTVPHMALAQTQGCSISGQVDNGDGCRCLDGQEVKQNKCVDTKQTIETKKRSKICMEDPNPQECFKRMAEETQNRSSGSGYDTSGLGWGGQGAVHVGIILMSIYLFRYWHLKSQGRIPECNALSMYFLSAGALTLIYSEIKAYLNYSKKLDEREQKMDQLKVQLNEKENDSTSQHTLSQNFTKKAYDDIIFQEKAYLEATKTRRIGYLIASSVFGASLLSATFELARGKPKCEVIPKSQAEQSNNSNGGGGKPSFLEKATPIISILSILIPIFGFGDHNIHSQESFKNLFHSKKSFAELSPEDRENTTSLRGATSMGELLALSKERDLLAQGSLSSPSLEDYKAFQKQSFMINSSDSEQLELMRTAMILKELLRGPLEGINLLLPEKDIAQADISQFFESFLSNNQ